MIQLALLYFKNWVRLITTVEYFNLIFFYIPFNIIFISLIFGHSKDMTSLYQDIVNNLCYFMALYGFIGGCTYLESELDSKINVGLFVPIAKYKFLISRLLLSSLHSITLLLFVLLVTVLTGDFYQLFVLLAYFVIFTFTGLTITLRFCMFYEKMIKNLVSSAQWIFLLFTETFAIYPFFKIERDMTDIIKLAILLVVIAVMYTTYNGQSKKRQFNY